MRKILSILFLVTVVLFAGCEKEDTFEEIVGLCPVVLATDPGNLETGVAVDKIITVTFNTEMNPATINAATITLNGPTAVGGTISYAGKIASFNPTVNLAPFTVYVGKVTTAVKDITGNALQVNYTWSFTTDVAGIPLGSASRFSVLAATGINNTGFTIVNNSDIGVSPGLRVSITGFPPGIVSDGLMYASNDLTPAGIPAMLILAHEELTNAYLFADTVTIPTQITLTGDLGGETLEPGIYNIATDLLIQSGDLTLDAKGDTNAYWIFRIGSDLTTSNGSGGNVILAGGAKAENVFWQVTGSTLLGNNTSFKGTILALSTIRMNADATIEGRLLSRNGSVILNTNTINKP
jgi:Ice-binding-like/Bacterial Ig-like domain